MFASRCFAAALIAASLTLAPVALAEDVAAAKALFQEGLEHMQAGAFEKGCPALRESYRLDARIGTLFTLAECEAKWGRVATALAHYSNFLTQVEAMPSGQRLKQSEREKIAREQRDKLTPQVPELTLVLPKDAPANTVVKRGNDVLRRPSLGVALPTDPGEYVLTTQVPGGKLVEKKLKLAKGEKKTVTLEVALPEPGAEVGAGAGAGNGSGQPGGSGGGPGPDGATAEEAGSGRRMAAYIVGGVGIAGLAAGGVFGGLTLARKNALQDEFGKPGGGCDFETALKCDSEAYGKLDDAKTLGWISTAGFGVGVAALGVAAVLLLTEPSEATKVGSAQQARPAPRRWMRAGVLAAGQDGAVFGVQGAW